MVVVYVGYLITLGLCPGFKSVCKILFSIQNNFQSPVLFNTGKSLGCFLKGVKKRKAAYIQSFEHHHDE